MLLKKKKLSAIQVNQVSVGKGKEIVKLMEKDAFYCIFVALSLAEFSFNLNLKVSCRLTFTTVFHTFRRGNLTQLESVFSDGFQMMMMSMSNQE